VGQVGGGWFGEPLLQPIVAAMTRAIPQRRDLMDAIFADGPCSVFEADD
jgi:hypothetical protein